MKSPRRLLPHSLASCVLLAAIVSLPSALHGVTYTWDGGSTTSSTWGTAANWNPDGAPLFNNAADLIFNNLTRSDNDTGAARTVASISYGANMDSAFNTNLRTFNGGAAAALTLDAVSGNVAINVDADATGSLSIGWSGTGTAGGALILAKDLVVTHNGTGTFSITRQINGTGFGFTKAGTGTMQFGTANANGFTGAVNVNQGRLIAASTASATGDLGAASGINLGGGILEIRTSNALNKTVSSNLTVSSASTLAYNNAAATDQTLTVGTGSMALNAGLTLQNISSSAVGNNAVNVSRNMTGSGSLTLETYNNIASSASSYSLGRIQLSGDNSGWSGNLVITKGTGQLSGSNSAGTGSITIGSTGDSFGAGLAINQSANLTLANNFIVRSGGFRSLKQNNQSAPMNLVLNGNVLLEGDLNVDHSLAAPVSGQSVISFNGTISGAGGLSITRSAGDVSSGVLLNGANTYLGATTVASGASLGGDGSIAGSLSFAAGANYIFSTTASLDVSGPVTFGGFSIPNLLGLDSSTIAGSYVLLNGTGSNITSTNISNLGSANAFALGSGNQAYFDFINGDLSVIVGAVIPEPSSFALLGGCVVFAVGFARRRRRAD